MRSRAVSWLAGFAFLFSALVNVSSSSEERAEEVRVAIGPLSFLRSYDRVFDGVAKNGETLEREVSILKSICNRLQFDLRPSCMDALTEYFWDEPVWAYAHSQNRFSASFRLESLQLNPRNSAMRYSFGDCHPDNLPRWRDIFEAQGDGYFMMLRSVIEDEKCLSLSTHSGGIRPELSARCEAEELFKYAAYLDACITNLVRLYSPSRLKLTSTHHPIAYKSLIREYWLLRMCSDRMFVDISSSAEAMEEMRKTKSDQVPYALKRGFSDTHDLLLRISAKAGNEWAMVAYLPHNESPEYLNDLMELKPALAHRYLSVLTPDLTIEQRLHHLAAAFNVTRQQFPDIDSRNYRKFYSFSHDAPQSLLERPLESFGKKELLEFP